MGGRKWTRDEDRLVREMARCGYTAQEIADELGRASKFSVYKRLVRIGGKLGRKAPVGPEVRSMVIGMLARGMTVPEIAAQRGVSPQSVREMVALLEAEGLVERFGRFLSRRYEAGWRAIRYRPTVHWWGAAGIDTKEEAENDQMPAVGFLRELTADTDRDEEDST